MSYALEGGAIESAGNGANTKPLTAADIDALFKSLSGHLQNHPKYKLPDNRPFQTVIVVHGGAIFVKLIKSRDTTLDVDYLAAYTDVLRSRQIADNVPVDMDTGDDSEDMGFDIISHIGAQSVKQGIVLYEDDGLKVYAMHWCWSFCRKLDRYNKKDKNDIVALLKYIEHPAIICAAKGDVQKAAESLWGWIEESCEFQILNWKAREFVKNIQDRIADVARALVEK